MARFLLQLLSCVAFASALDITGKITWNDVCPNATTLGQAKASLNEGLYSGGITETGDFTIPDVPDGPYILTILSHDHAFDQVRLDVANLTSEVRPYIAGTPMDPPSSVLLSYPVVLSPKERYVYFVPPERFNLGAMLANPMMLLMVGGGIMVLAMPYLMKNLDPQALEEFKEQHQQIQTQIQSGDYKGGLSSLMAGPDQQTQGSPSKASSTIKARGNKKAKR